MKLFICLLFLALSQIVLADSNPTEDLLEAISDNNLHRAKQAIHEGADVNNKRFYDSYTPLMMTANSNTAQITVLLINAGADINHTTIRNRTALQIAALNGSYEVALVLSSQKNMNTNHGGKQCALATAAGDGNAKIVKALTQLTDDQAPSEKCYTQALKLAERNSHEDVLKLLNP
jgi:ankyrin repeat protein